MARVKGTLWEGFVAEIDVAYEHDYVRFRVEGADDYVFADIGFDGKFERGNYVWTLCRYDGMGRPIVMGLIVGDGPDKIPESRKASMMASYKGTPVEPGDS